jgi:hypothetical protein
MSGPTRTTAQLLALLGIQGSSYLPVASDLVNLTSVTPGITYFHRIGTTVFVGGLIAIDAINLATFTQWRITLPVASDFVATQDAGGLFFGGIAAGGGDVLAVAGTQKVTFNFVTNIDVSPNTYGFSFAYQIL